MDNRDKTVEMALLFDFFSPILTEKQREYFDLYYNEDLSLAEIAENAGITRQGVRDFICRSEEALLKIEEKTGFVQKHLDTQKAVRRIEACISEIVKHSGGGEITALAEAIAGELESIKA